MRNPRDWTNGKGALPSSSNNTVTCRKAELRRENQWNRAWASLGSRLPYISLTAFLKGRHLRSIRSLEVRLLPNILHVRADKLPSGHLGWECCCNCPAAPHLCPVRLRSRISLRAGLATHDCEGGAWTPCTPHRRRSRRPADRRRGKAHLLTRTASTRAFAPTKLAAGARRITRRNERRGRMAQGIEI